MAVYITTFDNEELLECQDVLFHADQIDEQPKDEVSKCMTMLP